MPNTTGEIISIIGTLLLMVAVFVGAYYVTRLVGKRYNVPTGGAKRVFVLESTPVGKDSALMVVKAGEKIFLVGSTSHGINLISELDPESFPYEPTEQPKNSFRSVFRNTLIMKNGRPGEGEDN
ncbi:MAG: FliO/MopB family protein [Oscillospiraceae bacterium]|nr:flagellar biosynthetic protein FliO [Oscillospiraceae bacterium]